LRKAMRGSLGFVLLVLIGMGAIIVGIRGYTGSLTPEANAQFISGPTGPSACIDVPEKHECRACCDEACGTVGIEPKDWTPEQKQCRKDCAWRDGHCGSGDSQNGVGS